VDHVIFGKPLSVLALFAAALVPGRPDQPVAEPLSGDQP
jgi:hypothetical protein